MSATDILMILIGGTVIGVLGKALGPGDRDHIPLWLTVIMAMAGMVLANYVYVDIFRFDPNTIRVDWWKHTWQVVGAIVLVAITARITGRRRA